MRVMGLDIGYSNLKIVVGEVDAPGKSGDVPALPQSSVYPATAIPAALLPENVFGREPKTMQVEVPVDSKPVPYGVCIPAGRLSHYPRALHEDYLETPEYRALFHAALALSGYKRIEVLVTGLPSMQYADKSIREKLVKRLTGSHKLGANRSVTVEKVKVVPQPIGAYVDFLTESKRDVSGAAVLVIDPGFYSVDWVMIQDEVMRVETLGSSTKATSVWLDEMVRAIAVDKGAKIDPNVLEQALRQGQRKVFAHAQAIEIEPYLTAAVQALGVPLIHQIRASLREQRMSTSLILLAGGTADLLTPIIRTAFPQAELVSSIHPVAANARGFWRLGAMR